MPLEIERKYLIGSLDFLAGIKPVFIAQSYIYSDSEKILRLRIMDTQAFLTIKGKTEGISRPEYEYEIPENHAREMMELFCKDSIIIKKRYFLDYMGKTWSVDVFEGNNEGLVIAEIELSDPDEAFEIPPWVGKQVSHDKRYYNSYLIHHPFNSW
jgi:adenylate cyclase